MPSYNPFSGLKGKLSKKKRGQNATKAPVSGKLGEPGYLPNDDSISGFVKTEPKPETVDEAPLVVPSGQSAGAAPSSETVPSSDDPAKGSPTQQDP